MKKISQLIIYICINVICLSASNSTMNYVNFNGKNRSSIPEQNKTCNNNLKSIFETVYKAGEINSDSLQLLFPKLDKFIETSCNSGYKSLAYYYIANNLFSYYQANSSVINNRTAISDYYPTNLDQWSGNLFFQKICDALYKSLNTQTGEEYNLTEYRNFINNITNGGNYPLSNFITLSALNQLNDMRSYPVSDFLVQTPYRKSISYLPLDEFL